MATLDDVLITAELARRPARSPNYAAENRALGDLAEAMADSPQTILQKLVEMALDLCRADSAGISILEPGEAAGVFRWHAVAGQFASNIGGEMPREASPCGVVLDRNASVLFSYPERYFDYGMAIDPPIVETLLVPFHTKGKPVGSLWVIAHTPSRQFDAEDQRLLTSLSRFAAVAYQIRTALVVTDAGLKAKADEVRQILGAAAIGLTHSSRDLRYLACNRAYEKLVGLSAEQIIGRPMIDVLGTKAFEVIRPYIERVLRGERVEFEVEVPISAGEPRFFHVVDEPWFDSEGRVTGWIASVSEITDLKRATKALRESEERLRLAMSSGTIGVWDWDVISGRSTWSPELWGIFGVEPGSTHTYEDFSSRVHPDDLAAMESERDAAILNHKQFDLEFRIVRPSGETRWLSARGQGYYDENGRVVRVVGNNIDISERMQAKDALREREQRLRLALDASGAGSWIRDVRTGRVDWDDRIRELYGFTATEPASFEAWLSRVHEEDRRPVLEVVDQLLHTKTQDTFDCTYRIVRPDGTVLWMQSLGRANRDTKGQVTRLTGLELDITDRKRAEAALRQADRRKNEFLATLGHELRNPLAALSMGLELARRKDDLEPSLKRTLDMMDRQLTHFVRLVDDLLDIGRISAGKIELRIQPLTLSEILANSMEAVRSVIESRRHEVTVQIQPGRHRVRGDSARLTQVIANLIENAAKYTEPGGRIRVGLSQEDGNEVVRVEDTGIGIPPEELPRVFDLFSQVRVHQGKNAEGLGIGLAIVRTLVELHGGTVDAASYGLGHGSTFTIRLPVFEEATSRPVPGDRPQDESKAS